MGWWDRVKGAFGGKPRSRQPSKRTWRLTWQRGTLALVAPHGTFDVKAIAEPVRRALAGVADGTELVCEGEFEGGHTIEELVVTAAMAAHLDAIADAAIALLGDPAARPPKDELIVPCERLVVASDDRTEPLALATLRGHDGAIARTFERCGFAVRLIELVIQTDDEAEGFPETEEWGTYRLQRPIPRSLFENVDAVSYEDDSDTEEYGPMTISSIEPYLAGDGEVIEGRTWLLRRAAGAKLVYEGLYSVTGYFGNEAGDGFLYVAAALVLRLPA